MNKRLLTSGMIMVLISVGFLCIALFTETALDGLAWGFFGGSLGAGISSLGRFFYWNSRKHRKEYAKYLEEEQINRHDELKEKLRDKSGRWAYIWTLIVTAVSEIVFTILGALGIVENAKLFVFFLAGFLIFQYVIGVVLYYKLLKKY